MPKWKIRLIESVAVGEKISYGDDKYLMRAVAPAIFQYKSPKNCKIMNKIKNNSPMYNTASE